MLLCNFTWASYLIKSAIAEKKGRGGKGKKGQKKKFGHKKHKFKLAQVILFTYAISHIVVRGWGRATIGFLFQLSC
jgi:hypothetical protein